MRWTPAGKHSLTVNGVGELPRLSRCLHSLDVYVGISLSQGCLAQIGITWLASSTSCRNIYDILSVVAYNVAWMVRNLGS